MVTDVALRLAPDGLSFFQKRAPPSSTPQPLSQIFAPLPLDKSDAVIDANGTQRISVDFAGCCAQGVGLGSGESEREWLNDGAMAPQRN